MEEEKIKQPRNLRPNFGRLFIGLLIILIGAVYLLRNTGVIDLTQSLRWELLWPLIIIFIGLSLLTARNWLTVTLGVVATLAVLALVLGSLFIPTDLSRSSRQEQFSWGNWWGEEAETRDITIEKDSSAERAKIEIKTGAGTLDVSGGSNKLVGGTLESRFLTFASDSEMAGTTQEVELSTRGSVRGFGRQINDMKLNLNSETPMELKFDTGAIDMNLDLSSVMAESVDINTGASSLEVTMGDKVSAADLSIDAGASSIVVNLPKTVGARIKIDSGLSSKDLPDFTQIDEKTYESKDYGSREKKINLDLDLGATSLEVNWR